MNPAQSGRIEQLMGLGWDFEEIEVESASETLVFKATNTLMGVRMYLAVRADGSHKFYRQL